MRFAQFIAQKGAAMARDEHRNPDHHTESAQDMADDAASRNIIHEEVTSFMRETQTCGVRSAVTAHAAALSSPTAALSAAMLTPHVYMRIKG